MIDINNYILEKLHINKDYKLSFDFNDIINMIVEFIDKNYNLDHKHFTINTVVKSREDPTPKYIRFFTNYYTATTSDEKFRSNLIRYLYDNGIKSRIDYVTGASGVWVELKIYIIKTKNIDHISEKLHINKDYKVDNFDGEIIDEETFLKYLEFNGLIVIKDDKSKNFVKITKSKSKEYPLIAFLVYTTGWYPTTKDTIRVYKDLYVFDEYNDKEIGIHKTSFNEYWYDKYNANILIELMEKY